MTRRQKIMGTIGLAGAVVCLLFNLAAIFIHRFRNPDLTETRILFDCWPYILGAIAGAFLAGWNIDLMDKWRER